MKSALAICCSLVASLFVATADAGTVQFTDSSQLRMAGNLAAVNFYYNPHDGDANGNVQVASPIQGVGIQNLNVVSDNLTPFALTAGGSLTINLPNTDSSSARATTASIGGADAAAATQLATSISYFAAGDTGSLNFALGTGHANQNVDVQIVGGTEGWQGALTASVGGNPVGSLSVDSNPSAPGNSSFIELLTFVAHTDNSGNLEIDLAGTPSSFYPNSPYYGIAGVIVSTPEPSSITLLGFAAFGLAAFATRRRRKA